MKKLNHEFVQAIRRHVNPCPYFDLLSMRIMDLEWGRATLEIDVQHKHLQPFGVVHGGVFASLVDAAAFWAVYTCIPEETGMTSVDLKMNYLAPLSAGRMQASGNCLRVGKTLCLGEASVMNAAGQLIAHGTSTLMLLGHVKMQGEWPRKYME